MNPPSHDFVTVDMRGLKAALVARAQAERVSVSVLVRGAVARQLGLAMAAVDQQATSAVATSSAASVKLQLPACRLVMLPGWPEAPPCATAKTS